jgi:hypothetical protein
MQFKLRLSANGCWSCGRIFVACVLLFRRGIVGESPTFVSAFKRGR